MPLRSLHLYNLRCHEDLRLDGLTEGLNVFYGGNGRGKTTILEAVYLLARCRTFRNARTRYLARWETGGFRVEGRFEGETALKLSFAWRDGKGGGERRLGVDGIENAALHEFWGKCLAVVFRNADLDLVREGPAERRKWMDGVLASANPAYLPLVQKLQNVLKQRNQLLREEEPNFKLWETLTTQLWEVSEAVTREREAFFQKIQPMVREHYERLTDGRERFGLEYLSDFRKHEKIDWKELFEREVRNASSRVGAQRDDISLLLEGQSLRNFGSEGQQRSGALALRFAEHGLIRQMGKRPILLLDDVLREFDAARRKRFWELIPADTQIFLASTRPETELEGVGDKQSARFWTVSPSQVRQNEKVFV